MLKTALFKVSTLACWTNISGFEEFDISQLDEGINHNPFPNKDYSQGHHITIGFVIKIHTI